MRGAYALENVTGTAVCYIMLCYAVNARRRRRPPTSPLPCPERPDPTSRRWALALRRACGFVRRGNGGDFQRHLRAFLH